MNKKRLAVSISALALLSVAAYSYAATTVPVQLLNPTGSTAGQAIVSTGASSAPGWANVGLAPITANSVLANATGSSAVPTGVAVPSCSSTSSALQYTSASGFGCVSLTGRLVGVQVFSTSGTYTPSSGVTLAVVEMVGAGGGGGGSTTTGAGAVSFGAGGSAGSYAKFLWNSPSSQTVTVGTGGTAGAAGGGTGGAGGTTSIGSVASCPGGNGGAGFGAGSPPQAAQGANPPSGCTLTGVTTIQSYIGGRGGDVLVASVSASIALGGTPTPLSISRQTGAAQPGFGMGGPPSILGQSSTGVAGFAGTPGGIIVYEYR